MKKILFICSILTLMSYGCNRNQERGAGEGGGAMEREESRSQDTQSTDPQNQQSPTTEDPSSVSPGSETQQ